MANKGTATLNFGAAPGTAMASVDVTGQTGLVATTSFAEAFLQGDSTADHTVDEHLIEQIKLRCINLIDNVGFTIQGEILKGRAYGQFTVRWVWN